MTTAPEPRAAQPAKVGEQMAKVEAARSKLVGDLGRLDDEVRLEVAYRMEKIAWKVVAGIAGAAAAVIVTKVLNLVWAKARPDPPPENPADPETGWGEALLWTAATGIGMGVARMIAQRGAAMGWQKATGHVAPPFEKDEQGS